MRQVLQILEVYLATYSDLDSTAEQHVHQRIQARTSFADEEMIHEKKRLWVCFQKT